MGGSQSSSVKQENGGGDGSRKGSGASAHSTAALQEERGGVSGSSSSSITPAEQQDEEARRKLELAKLRQRLLRPALHIPAPVRAEHERDHALVLDLMEFFCFAIKPDPSFSGSMTFVFDQELDEDMEGGGDGRVKPELELSVTIEKRHQSGPSKDSVDAVISRRPRVVVTLGGPPHGAGEAKGRVRVPYKQFLLIYSGKASARDVATLAMHRNVELTGFGSFMQFGLSFDYGSATWDRYYDIKSSLGAGGDSENGGHAEEGSGFGNGGGASGAAGSGDDGERDERGARGQSPPVLFSSDGFRQLERLEKEQELKEAQEAREKQQEQKQAQVKEQECARRDSAEAAAAAAGRGEDSESDSDCDGEGGGTSGPSGGGGGGGDGSAGGAGGGWEGRVKKGGQRVAGWIRSLPGGRVLGGGGKSGPFAGSGSAAPEGGQGEGPRERSSARHEQQAWHHRYDRRVAVPLRGAGGREARQSARDSSERRFAVVVTSAAPARSCFPPWPSSPSAALLSSWLSPGDGAFPVGVGHVPMVVLGAFCDVVGCSCNAGRIPCGGGGGGDGVGEGGSGGDGHGIMFGTSSGSSRAPPSARAAAGQEKVTPALDCCSRCHSGVAAAVAPMRGKSIADGSAAAVVAAAVATGFAGRPWTTSSGAGKSLDSGRRRRAPFGSTGSRRYASAAPSSSCFDSAAAAAAAAALVGMRTLPALHRTLFDSATSCASPKRRVGGRGMGAAAAALAAAAAAAAAAVAAGAGADSEGWGERSVLCQEEGKDYPPFVR